MKVFVLNSPPLIYLAKVGCTDVIAQLRADKITSPSVKREVVDRGRAKGAPEVEAISELFDDEVVRLLEPRDESLLKRLLGIRGLAMADAEVLALAKERKGVAVIDDKLPETSPKFMRYLMSERHICSYQPRGKAADGKTGEKRTRRHDSARLEMQP